MPAGLPSQLVELPPILVGTASLLVMEQGKLITRITAGVGALTILLTSIHTLLEKVEAITNHKIATAIEIREPGPIPPSATEMRLYRLEDRVDSLEVKIHRR